MSQEHITTLFEDLDAGVFAQKIQHAISQVALGVATTGKKGKLTITFDMDRLGETNQVKCVHTVKSSSPTPKGRITEENAGMTPLHVGAGGKLTLFPETQQPLFNKDGSPRSESKV